MTLWLSKLKVYSLDSWWKNVITQMIDGPDEDGDFEAIFLKRSMKIKDGFFHPEIEDLASIELADLMRILSKPMSTATTKCSAGVMTFDVEVSAFGDVVVVWLSILFRRFRC